MQMQAFSLEMCIIFIFLAEIPMKSNGSRQQLKRNVGIQDSFNGIYLENAEF